MSLLTKTLRCLTDLPRRNAKNENRKNPTQSGSTIVTPSARQTAIHAVNSRKTMNSSVKNHHRKTYMRHYAPYIEQERKASEIAKKDESIQIPLWLNYDECQSIRYESREKLKKYKPETLAQASRIPGVNPADISILAILIKRGYVSKH